MSTLQDSASRSDNAEGPDPMPPLRAGVEPTVTSGNQPTAQFQAHTSSGTNCLSFVPLNLDPIRDSTYADAFDQQRNLSRLPISCRIF